MKNNIKKISLTGLLAAMSTILYIFPTFPIFPAFIWLEIDFADIPALFAAVAINPIIGAVVILIRNTIHLLVTTTGMVGELSNFIISSVFVVSLGFLSHGFSKKHSLSLKRLLLAAVLGIVVQNITAVLCNKFIMIPLYGIQGDPLTYILAGVVPFNAIKTAVSTGMFIVLYRVLLPKIRTFI